MPLRATSRRIHGVYGLVSVPDGNDVFRNLGFETVRRDDWRIRFVIAQVLMFRLDDHVVVDLDAGAPAFAS